MTSTTWNQRYVQSELVWSASANLWVQEVTEVTQDLPAGDPRTAEAARES